MMDTIKALVEHKKYDAITEYAKVLHGKDNLIVSEYCGSSVRLYKDNDNKVRILCPKNLETVQEGYLAKAIADGSVFDDADEIDRNASVIERTTLPYDAMLNSGKEIPTNLKPMIAIVVGRMGDDGNFGVTDADRTNGINFVKDATAANANGDTVNGVVDNYLEKKDGFYTPEIGRNISGLNNELGEVNSTDPGDVVSDDDTVDSYDDYDMNDFERDPDAEPENEEGESDDDIDNDNDSDDDVPADNEEPVEDPVEEPVEECGDCTCATKKVEECGDAPVVEEDDETLNQSMEEEPVEAGNGDLPVEAAEEDDPIATGIANSIIAKYKRVSECGNTTTPTDGKTIVQEDDTKNGEAPTNAVDDPTEPIQEEYNDPYEDGDIFVQEGVIGAIKTLKRIGYDPKTKTILTDIPAPNGKKGERVRCDIKIGDAQSMMSGLCITGLESGPLNRNPKPCIHIPVKNLLGNSEETISALKHEEGHLYISMDRERFNKDFDNAKKLVVKHSAKLTDHGNVPEEYVADLYSAKTRGDNGEGLIAFLKNYGQKNRVAATKLKKHFSEEATQKLINLVRKFGKQGEISEHEEALMKAAGFDKDGFIEAYTKTADTVTETICSTLKIEKAGAGEYTKTHEEIDNSRTANSGKAAKKALSNLKTGFKDLKACISGVRKITSSNIGGIENQIKKCVKDVRDRIDEFVHATDTEIKARIAFIRKYVNESAYIDSDDDMFIEYDSYQEEDRITENERTEVVNEEKVESEDDKKDVVEEGFLSKRPKKLKPIGRDVVAYITCEMNDIHSANDQAMLAGYTCSKIELVDWYITCIDTQDPKYMVPHTRQYLVTMKAQLESLLAQILKIRPINRSEQIWRVNYPSYN